MKTIALAAALSVAASSVFAGSMSDPVIMEAPMPIIETVEEQSSSSSGGGLIVPVLALVLLGAAVASSD